MVIVASLNFVGGIASLVTQAYMARNLSKNEFGLINTIFSVSILLSIFLSAHKYWIIQDYSVTKGNILHRLKIFHHHVAFMVLVIFILGIVTFIFKEQIYLSFKFNNDIILLLFLITNLCAFIGSPLSAYFQSTGQFLIYGLGSFISNAFKLVFLGVFLLRGLTIENTYLTFILSSVFALIFYTFFLVREASLKNLFKAFYWKTEKTSYHHKIRKLLQYLASAFVFSAIFNFDIILVRYLLAPEVSGDYAAASLIGKTIYFLSAVIIEVFYPSVIKVKADLGNTHHILLKGLIIAFFIGGSGFFFIYFLTPVLNETFFVGKFGHIIHLINMYSLFSFIMVLNSVYINFLVATKKFIFVFALGFFPFIQFFLISHRAQNALDVVQINNVIATCLLALMIFSHLLKWLKIKKNND